MDALYQYLFRRARAEGSIATPQRFVHGGVGDLVISANPLMGSSQIDPGIMTALVAEEFRTRLGAVTELTLQMDEVHTVAARAARRVLERHLLRERDFQVRRAIARALEGGSNRPSEAARPAEEEKRRAEAARQAEEEKQRAGATPQRPRREQDGPEAKKVYDADFLIWARNELAEKFGITSPARYASQARKELERRGYKIRWSFFSGMYEVQIPTIRNP
jgi:hypothetical protein